MYIMLGHAGETSDESHVVPKGCILVAKSHSGDVTKYADYKNNIKAVLNKKNKESVFDPVSHRKELFSLLSAKSQENENPNITAGNSVTIYREGDIYPNFSYQPFSKFPSFIGQSGGLSLKYESTSVNHIDMDKEYPYSYTYNVFVKDNNTIVYSPDIIKLDIPSFFSNSDMYPYYYTKQHIQDILDVILEYMNAPELTDGIIEDNILTKERKLIEKLGEKYLNIKKGFVYNPEYRYTVDNINYFENTPTFIIDSWITNKENISMVDKLFNIIILITNTTQADIFKDVQDGIIQPGIFYHLACRASEHTFFKNKTNKSMNSIERSGLLDKKYIGTSTNPGKIVREIKARISEAALQRKIQAQQVFNDKAKRITNYDKIKVDTNPTGIIIEYYDTMVGLTDYEKLYEIERKHKNIKLQVFNYILSDIETHKVKLKEPNLGKYRIETINNVINIDNNILSKFYSKDALLNENNRLTDIIANENDPKEIQFLKSKIEFNNKFIHDNIEHPLFSSFLKLFRTNNQPKILTNTFKKYRAETPTEYNKAKNGKWIKRASTGGRRLTRKRKILT